jgi:hypothetical protein
MTSASNRPAEETEETEETVSIFVILAPDWSIVIVRFQVSRFLFIAGSAGVEKTV